MYIEACYKFLENLNVIKNASEHTVRNYAIDLNFFKSFLEQEWHPSVPAEDLPPKISHKNPDNQKITNSNYLLPLQKIDRKIIRKFLALLSFKKENKRTIARRLSSLRSFFKFTRIQQWIEEDPTEELESPRLDRKLPTPLTYAQVCHLFEQPDIATYLGYRDRTMMELFYSSGLRIGELVGLNQNDVDLNQLTIKLRGKGKKERIIPITANAAKWIKSYLEHAEREENTLQKKDDDYNPIFLNKFGTRLTARSVNRRFEEYLKQSGLAGTITPHTLRHTIATHWLQNGMDLNTIKLLLGHSALSTTTIYTQVSPELKKKVYNKAHPRA